MAEKAEKPRHLIARTTVLKTARIDILETSKLFRVIDCDFYADQEKNSATKHTKIFKLKEPRFSEDHIYLVETIYTTGLEKNIPVGIAKTILNSTERINLAQRDEHFSIDLLKSFYEDKTTSRSPDFFEFDEGFITDD